MKIGQLSRATGLPIDTIRYYENQGVLPRAERQASSGYRVYDHADVERLQFIRRAKALGFTLVEIRELMAMTQGEDVAAIREAAVAKLVDVEERLQDLGRIRDGLQSLVDACPGRGKMEACPIVHALTDQASAERKHD